MNLDLMSHQQLCHMELGHRFKVPSERPEKRGIDLAPTGLVVQCVIHFTTVTLTDFLYFFFFFSNESFTTQQHKKPFSTESTIKEYV